MDKSNCILPIKTKAKRVWFSTERNIVRTIIALSLSSTPGQSYLITEYGSTRLMKQEFNK
jgi:hypothetical protein